MLSNEEMVVYVKERRRKIKEKIIDCFGGKCCSCGYDRYLGALDLHHINPEKKEFSFRNLMSKSLKTIVAECRKCLLLCSNCHREYHAGKLVLPEDVPRIPEDFVIEKRKNQYN